MKLFRLFEKKKHVEEKNQEKLEQLRDIINLMEIYGMRPRYVELWKDDIFENVLARIKEHLQEVLACLQLRITHCTKKCYVPAMEKEKDRISQVFYRLIEKVENNNFSFNLREVI